MMIVYLCLMNQDTICALATANGMAAIGMIRVSGKDSIRLVNGVFSRSHRPAKQFYINKSF